MKVLLFKKCFDRHDIADTMDNKTIEEFNTKCLKIDLFAHKVIEPLLIKTIREQNADRIYVSPPQPPLADNLISNQQTMEIHEEKNVTDFPSLPIEVSDELIAALKKIDLELDVFDRVLLAVGGPFLPTHENDPCFPPLPRDFENGCVVDEVDFEILNVPIYKV